MLPLCAHVYCVMKSGSMEYLGTNNVNSKMLSTFVSMLIEQVASLLWNPSSSELVLVSSPQLITFINRTAQIFFVCMSTLVMTGHFKVLRFTTPPSVSGQRSSVGGRGVSSTPTPSRPSPGRTYWASTGTRSQERNLCIVLFIVNLII